MLADESAIEPQQKQPVNVGQDSDFVAGDDSEIVPKAQPKKAPVEDSDFVEPDESTVPDNQPK